jgi:hypothetical protein
VSHCPRLSLVLPSTCRYIKFQDHLWAELYPHIHGPHANLCTTAWQAFYSYTPSRNILILSYSFTLVPFKSRIDSSMYTSKLPAKLPLSKQTATKLSRAVASFTYSYPTATTHGFRLSCITIQQQQQQPRRYFSATSSTQLREYFPKPPDAPHIKKTELTWPHPE